MTTDLMTDPELVENWRTLPAGTWFFEDCPTCTSRYSVMERTSSGCVSICSTSWIHEKAKRDMKEIAERHNFPRTELERQAREIAAQRPTIVCLCGSTRFYEQFQRANYGETMAGKIVLSVGFYPHAQKEMHHEEAGCTPEQKIALDVLHKQKIDLCDEVLVLNVGGYIGSSTRSEIEHAQKIGKPIRYLEVRPI